MQVNVALVTERLPNMLHIPVKKCCEAYFYMNWKESNYFEKSMLSLRILSFDSFEVI